MTCACTGIATPTPATHDSTGANTCDCGDGTMTCACTGIATPTPTKQEECEAMKTEKDCEHSTIEGCHWSKSTSVCNDHPSLLQVAHGPIGANTCACDDGTMTCACTGIATPNPATHDSTGANTCDCGDGTMTCACTGIATPTPATHDSTGANTCACGDGTMTCACTSTATPTPTKQEECEAMKTEKDCEHSTIEGCHWSK